jgi:hypothetical protein
MIFYDESAAAVVGITIPYPAITKKNHSARNCAKFCEAGLTLGYGKPEHRARFSQHFWSRALTKTPNTIILYSSVRSTAPVTSPSLAKELSILDE